MTKAFINMWRLPELRARILFTLVMICIVRLGVHITLPGVDASVIKAFIEAKAKSDPNGAGGGFSAMLQVFAGGGLQQAGLFALGIMPFISAQIMVQLMTAVIPSLARLSREDNGREKITQYTRGLTLLIAVIQGFFVAKGLEFPANNPFISGIEKYGVLVPNPDTLWYIVTTLTVVSATMFLMWIGDMMTDRGIGNGTSMIITVNIIAALPGALVSAWHFFVGGVAGQPAVDPGRALWMLVLVVLMLLVIAGTITLTEGQRKIAVEYAKRVVGRKQYGGQRQYMPLKVNYSGVMPIIFASAVMVLPTTLLSMVFPDVAWIKSLHNQLGGASSAHYIFGGLMIFFFAYFWVATMFQPSQISEDLKKNGGYIPGVRPGKPTADYLDFTMTRLTFAGAIFLVGMYVLPAVIGWMVGLNPNTMILQFFGGTSLLILVGVVLDTMRQVETHLIQQHYDGFLRKGKTRNRYDRLASHTDAVSSKTLMLLWIVVAVFLVLGGAFWIMNR